MATGNNNETCHYKASSVAEIVWLSLVVLDNAGSSRLLGTTPRSQSTFQLYMQAYEVADSNIADLLATGPLPQKPAVLETAEKGTHVAVCSFFLRRINA